MGAYRRYAPNFLGVVRRVPPVNAYRLGLSLGEGPRTNAKALKCVFSASERIGRGQDTPEEDFRSDFSLPTKIVNSDGMELNSDFLSSAMSTDALVANDMVPEGFRASSEKSSDLLIQLINGKRYLTVD
jgi:hypothetical protein